MHIPAAFLKMPPTEALTRFLVEAPSVLTLIQVVKGGDQITSLIVGALGGLILTCKLLGC